MNNPFDRQSFQNAYRKHRGKFLAGQATAFLLVGFLLARSFQSSGPKSLRDMNGAEPVTNVATGESMWTCSMHPQIRQPNPGKCPICGMDLIPVATTSAGLRTLRIGPETRALMNIATQPVERRYVTHEVPMVGKVDFDETTFGQITAWVPGRLDELYVDYTGVQVNKGDHMAFIYSPQLYSAQEELIQALKFQAERSSTTRLTPSLDLAEAAREKLRLLGLTEEQVKEIEQQQKPNDHLTIYSPTSGVVIEKLKQEGDYVKTGERIYTVADLNQVWVHLDAYESDLVWVRYGQDVTITAEAYPGEQFHGRIAFIQPVLNDKTRTVKVRVNVPNPDGKLKPDMFVRAVVKPQVAAGGRVMDASLAGKWISPMHPEIVKDEPGTCDICGMPLVRAESLGFVRPETDDMPPPVVIPYSAALVTGRRAVVYVELPLMPDGLEAAYGELQMALEKGELSPLREAFTQFGNFLDRPYGQPGTDYARNLWNSFANQFAHHALAGKRAESQTAAAEQFAQIEQLMNRVQEEFGPPDQPTFEGREIVLGPRAGNYYLVSNGLSEGEMVVTQGSFKIDAEIQIQAKPSMMTPTAGGATGNVHAGHDMSLSAEFIEQFRDLEAAYKKVSDAVEKQALGQINAAFTQFGQTLAAVDATELTGDMRIQWKEFQMQLSNDAVEGRDVQQPAEADRVFVLLKGHMRQMRERLGVTLDSQPRIESLDVPEAFQNEMAALWERYLAIQSALAADELTNAQQGLTAFESALATVGSQSLSGRAQEIWNKERQDLEKLVADLAQTKDIKTMRAQFKPLSEEIGVLAKTFGFGEAGSIYELHCPMAFQGQGALWYQDSEQVQNPYFGASMLSCADRVKKVVRNRPAATDKPAPDADHSQH